MARAPRLMVMANRLPVHRVGRGADTEWARSPGGLVTALEPILRERSGVWLGWPGDAGRTMAPFEVGGITMRPIALSQGEIEAYYHGFSNETIWPLYHDAIRTPKFKRSWWASYQAVNQRFALAAARSLGQNDTAWIHDYQLQLAPKMLRDKRPRCRIGFFLHIPFPPEELFAWLPWRSAILRGLLGADVVGFQTFENAQNFSRVARRYTPATGTDTELSFEGRTIQVGAFPISTEFREFEQIASRPEVIAESLAIRRRLGPRRKVILSVDRLDYTKGIGERLQAFQEALRKRALRVEECVFMQVAVPSREHVRDYKELRSKVEQTVGRINGEYSEPGMVAVHYFRRSLTRETLVAYYLAADVMLVTPLRDGMNLVAKEYVAARRDNSGVLVLSEFAGAAKELRRALVVNPRDIDGLSATMVQAVKMSREEAAKRMVILRMQVRRHDVHYWAETFLEKLAS